MSQSKKDAGAKPDYEHWSQYAIWEFEQFVALSLDLDPQIVSTKTVQSPGFPGGLRARYEKQYAVLHSHRAAGRFPNSYGAAP